MSEIQNLKKSACDGECPRCPVLNLAQRRIGTRRITDPLWMEGIARYLQKERCPDGMTMQVKLLNPSRSPSPRRNLVW